MAVASFLIIVGFVLLYYGAEFIVDGSSFIAKKIGIAPIVIGLTVVALGTSLPEGFVSFVASFQGNASICLSNVVGSNIINVAFILGLAAWFFPIKIDKNTVNVQVPFMILVTLLLVFFVADKNISRLEGFVLFSMFIGFNYLIVRNAIKKRLPVEDEHTKRSTITASSGKVVLGFVVLTLGAYFLVDNAVFIAKQFGVPQWLIGVTIVAIGTSLPEMATSIMASLKKQGDISVGNIVGSNIFNILFVVGLSALINPIILTESAGFWIDIWVMVGFSGLLFGLMRIRHRLGKFEGACLAGGYFIFMIHIIMNALKN